MESTPARLVVGLAGQEGDVPVIRYAAMLARLTTVQDESVRRSADRIAEGSRGDSCISVASTEAVETGRFPEVRFVHVQPRCGAVSPAQLRRRLRERVRKYFPSLPLPVGCDLLRGSPAHRLANFAADFDSDLILVSRSLCAAASCGRLAMTAPCPVWFVPADWPPLIRRILVPVRLSAGDHSTLRTAIGLARRFPRAKVLALNVHLEGAAVADETAYRQIQRRRQADLETFLAAVATEDVTIEPHLAIGVHVGDLIASVAHRQSVDLIILSTRGRSWPARLLLPSVAERASRQASASVLVLKNSESPLGFLRALGEKIRAQDTLRFN